VDQRAVRPGDERRLLVNEAFPGGEHPHQDLLADLAAGVLPLDQARLVEAHVIACQFCERILVDAERVRSLLSPPDPGPMPVDVWARIESGLAGGRSAHTRASETRNWLDTPAPVPAPPPSMSFDEAPTAAWKAFLTEPAEPPPAAPAQQRVGRAVRSVRSRRDVRAEDRGEPAWWARPGVLTGVAAAGLAVLGLGGWAAVSFIGGGGPADSAADALPGRNPRSVIHASGADYTASTLVQQATSLARTGSPVATAKQSGSGSSIAGGSAAPVTPGTVTDPTQLTACLRSLGESDREPLAVDLARYQGREAAVIVLAGKVGGYDIWVVARDCRPGAEGPLAFKSAPG
jgi:hypothetical protein